MSVRMNDRTILTTTLFTGMSCKRLNMTNSLVDSERNVLLKEIKNFCLQ